jgi:hypothetical protein
MHVLNKKSPYGLNFDMLKGFANLFVIKLVVTFLVATRYYMHMMYFDPLLKFHHSPINPLRSF